MPVKNPILSAGSKEAEIKSYLEKIQVLQDDLARLTILENPVEIERICKSIIDLKKSLEKANSAN